MCEIIPFDRTSEQLDHLDLELDSAYLDETIEESIDLTKENSSLIVVKVEDDKWVGFITDTDCIQDREEVIEASKEIVKSMPNMVYVSEQACRHAMNEHSGSLYSSIIIIFQ